MLVDLRLYFDGSCINNPGGPAAWGFYVLDEQSNRIAEGMGAIPKGGIVTNNVAEWEGLLNGMRWLQFQRTHSIDKLTVYGDSDMVIRQARCEWKCKKPHLQEYLRQLKMIVSALDVGAIEFAWVPREENQDADELSNRAYQFV